MCTAPSAQSAAQPATQSAAPPGTPGELAAELAALRARIEADQSGWQQALARLAQAVDRLHGSGADAQGWLALLDEAHALAHGLEQRRATLAEQIRGLASHRRADAAYTRRGQQP